MSKVMSNIPSINMLYEYALDNSEYIMIKELFYSALFFNTAAAMSLKKIRIVRKTNNQDKIIIPNYFGITFAGSGCVDEETEFLTPKGWKKISEYEAGDLVCQWSEDGSTQFVNPIAYISEPEKRECYYIDGGKNSNTNRFLCPDHRVPYLTEEKKYKNSVYKSKLKVAKASDIFERNSGFKFPTNFKKPESDTKLDLTDDEIRLQVAFFADGTITNRYKDYNGKIRVKKQYKIDRLKMLLDRNGSTYKTSITGEYTMFWINIKIQEKVYNDYWYNCSNEQLKVIFEEAHLWDGSLIGGKKTFRTTIKETADFMQYVYTTQSENYVSFIKKERHNKVPFHTEYRISETLCKNKSVTKNMIKKKHMPNFMKYCFTVPSSFWVARRNNFICIEGNCGKNHSDNLARAIYKDLFTKFEGYAEEFYNDRKDPNDRKPDPRYVNLSSYFIPVTSTWQALQKAAQTVKDMDIGSVNVVSDELGDNIMSMSEIFTKLKSTWDTGTSEGPVNVTNGGESYFCVHDVCFNALLFGAPGPFELDTKKKDRLLEIYVSGMARRSFIYHNNTYKKSENRNPNFEKLPKEFYDELDKYIKELRYFINNTKEIRYPAKIREKLLEYDQMKELERERSISLIAEDLGSTKKIEKLMGIIATLDLSEEISEEHLKFAIEFTEALDSTAEETVEIKPAYKRIYDEIEKRSYAARTDIVKAVKDITIKDLDSQLILVQEYANLVGNSLIKKEYNGIIKYKIEKLSNTSLDNIILSVNPNMDRTEPEGFIRKIGSFDKLVNAINGDFRYSAGTFRNEYISDENYMQEQNLFIIDIDNDLTIEDAKALFSSITYLITTTKSHQKPKKTKINGESVEVVCDRFRIIIPTLSTFHLTPKVYSEMYMNVINSLGIAEADTKCRNASRWYYGNPEGEHWYNYGDLLDIRTYIPDSSENQDATTSINNYDKSHSDKSNAPSSIRVDAAIRWFLSNTATGNRNDNLFKLGMLLKEKIEEPEWALWLRNANSCLSHPLPDSDMKSIIGSVGRR